MAESNDFNALSDARYISLTTYRKSGVEVSTPVWFILLDGKVYVQSPAKSGKIKRLRNNPQVQLAACDRSGKLTSGPTLSGTARMLSEQEAKVFLPLLGKRFGFLPALLRAINKLRGAGMAYLEITPTAH